MTTHPKIKNNNNNNNQNYSHIPFSPQNFSNSFLKKNSYVGNEPAIGYKTIQSWCKSKKFGGFAETSNIDGHWEASGFDPSRVYEIHGTLRYMQCQRTKSCPHYSEIWESPRDVIFNMQIDEETDKVVGEMPSCPGCGDVARPAVLMFGDFHFLDTRTDKQAENLSEWLGMLQDEDAKLVVIEIGAGVAVPSIRIESNNIAEQFGCPLIRINPEHPLSGAIHGESDLTSPFIGIPLGGEDAIKAIDDILSELKSSCGDGDQQSNDNAGDGGNDNSCINNDEKRDEELPTNAHKSEPVSVVIPSLDDDDA